MDLATLIGMGGGTAIVLMAIFMGGSFMTFVNVPSLLIVVGGAISATILRFTLSDVVGALKIGISIALAQSNGFPVWRIMFDGYGDEELQGVSAAKIRAIGAGEPMNLESALVADLPSWRIRLAFFPLNRRTPEPDREQEFRVFANGVVDELVIDYGEFTIDADLEGLSPLPVPSC